MATISKDTPLSEITLRKYEKPADFEKRNLIRKFCLSMGLLQPGDSRDVIVDVLQVLLESKKEMSSANVEKLVIENREKYKLALLGIAPSNIRRQLLRLRDLFFIEKVANDYRVREKMTFSDIFDEHIEKYYLDSIMKRVKEYLKEIDRVFLKP